MTKKEMAGSEQERITICECVFCICVDLLQRGAAILNPVWPGGMDYVKINVILFCIILPLVLVGLVGTCAFLLLK